MMTALSKRQRPKAILLMAHAPHLDPRVDWMARSLSAMCDVCEIGMFGWSSFGMVPSVETLGPHRWRIQVDRTFHGDDLGGLARTEDADVLRAGGLLQSLKKGGAEEGELQGSEAASSGLAKYIYDSNQALIQTATLLGAADLVVGCDFEALPAAVIVGKAFGASIVYDAHEYWPYSINGLSDREIDFWRKLDRFYAQQADYRIAVSTQLAEVMSADYGAAFVAIPNAVPVADAGGLMRKPAGSHRTDQTTFLFQGNFAEGRGLSQLIDAWPHTAETCILKLRGPDNPFKAALMKQASELGLLGRRIVFPDALPEGDLIAGAMEEDVGLIPYEPVSLNNKFCCPNKLSQYMAAGIPIIANDLVFVKEQIERAGCGVSVAFSEPERLRITVNRYASDIHLRRDQGDRGRRYFEAEFNWDNKVQPFLKTVASHLVKRPGVSEEFQLERILDARAVPDVVLRKLQAPWVELGGVYLQEIIKTRTAYEAWIESLRSEHPGPLDSGQPCPSDEQGILARSVWDVAQDYERDLASGIDAAGEYLDASRVLEQEIAILRSAPTKYAAVTHASDVAARAEVLKVRLSDHLEILEFLRGNIRTLDQLRAGAASHRVDTDAIQAGEVSALIDHLGKVSNLIRTEDVAGGKAPPLSGFSPLSDENRRYLKYVRDLGEYIFYRYQIAGLIQSIGVGQRYRKARDLAHIVKASLGRRQYPTGIRSRLERIEACRHKAEKILLGLASTDVSGNDGSCDFAEWRDATTQAVVRERRDLFEGLAAELGRLVAEILAARFGPASKA